MPQAAPMRKAPPGPSRGGHGTDYKALPDVRGTGRSAVHAGHRGPARCCRWKAPSGFPGRWSTRHPVHRGGKKCGARLLSPWRRRSVTGSGQTVKKGRRMRGAACVRARMRLA
ncbi:hypothetical protein DESPIG_02275 [Desulfovibrio piger ATCC 29098]|uniref:Uncharacterized protein n=1 Tax=Desulfovibrio piger ATCC 29098 TaxID=411464 RepID=B6WW07_9BACT|nr:hypothetical protein DESPIG_02275 [Desulfovibrio piger ATCC 29098]